MTADVTAVVVTWNSADVIEDLLDSLPAAAGALQLEVVVVDNASSDGCADRARAHPLRPRVIANDRNLGLAAANNQGMAAGSADLLLISNPDVVAQPGSIEALVACADEHPRAAFVIARLHHADGALQTGVGDLPTFGEAWRGRRSARVRKELSGFWWDGWAHDTPREVGHGQEAFYLVRRAAVREVGDQDPGYRLDWEGIDWAARMRSAGWELWFTPDARAVHIGGTSLGKARARSVLWSHIGMYRYFATRSSRAVRPLLAVAIGARCALKLAVLPRRSWYARALRVEE